MKNRPSLTIYKTFLFVLISIIGCSPASKTEKSQSIPERLIIWDESDSESLADSLVSISLQAEWNKNFSMKSKPIIVVGKIVDNSNENIDVSLFAKYIERSLLNSGEVSFIQSKEMRETIRNDRKSKSDFTDNMKFSKYLKSLKSDFFLCGDISLNIDSTIVPIQKRYTLNAEIISTKNASIVWQDEQIIKK